MSEKKDTAKDMKANISQSAAIVFSFDTTGSMNPCIQQVRQQLRDVVEMLRQDKVDVKIGLIAHGDYCDGDNAIKVLDLTDDLEKIMTFINTTPNTGGGDAPECYELALNRARSMSWPKEGGSLVLIGDDEPHGVNYPGNTDHLNWKEEVKALKAANVNVFPMQCLFSEHRTLVNKFWEEVSGLSETPLLILENFKESGDVLGAVAYATAGSETYENYASKSLYDTGSANMTENRSKLRAFSSKSKVSDKPVSEEKTEADSSSS